MNRLLAALLLSMGLQLTPSFAHAQVTKWVDEAGQTHYGDTVPDKYKRKAKPVPITDTTPSDRDVQEAQGRAQKDQALARAAQAPSSPASAQGLNAAGAPAPDKRPPTCDEQWESYSAAQACFAPYRNANGSLKPEAFQKCPEIKSPELCGRRSVIKWR